MIDSTITHLRSGPRAVVMRPGVGAAGHIVQRSDLTSHQITVGQPTLILVEEGRKCIRWSGGECAASAGEALSLQAGAVVDIANTPGRSGTYRALWICWSDDLLLPSDTRNQPSGSHPFSFSPTVAQHGVLNEAFRASFYRAFDSLSDLDGLPPSIAVSRLQEVLLWLSERGFQFSPAIPSSLGQQVRHLLSTDPSFAWSMEHVAAETATSVPTLRRKLSAEGIVFRDLVLDVRMSHALALLQNTDAPVLHVALAAGYASASRFTARFRTRFGYLPTDIRGQNRGRMPAPSAEDQITGTI